MFNLQKTTKKIAALLLSMATVFAITSCERWTVMQYALEYGAEIFKVEVETVFPDCKPHRCKPNFADDIQRRSE